MRPSRRRKAKVFQMKLSTYPVDVARLESSLRLADEVVNRNHLTGVSATSGDAILCSVNDHNQG